MVKETQRAFIWSLTIFLKKFHTISSSLCILPTELQFYLTFGEYESRILAEFGFGKSNFGRFRNPKFMLDSILDYMISVHFIRMPILLARMD